MKIDTGSANEILVMCVVTTRGSSRRRVIHHVRQYKLWVGPRLDSCIQQELLDRGCLNAAKAASEGTFKITCRPTIFGFPHTTVSSPSTEV